MSRLSGLLSTLAGLAAVVLAVWYLKRPAPPGPVEEGRPPFVLPVTLGPVQQGTLRPAVNLTGTVRCPARAQLAFEVAGPLARLEVREVERFAAGDLLAQLDDQDEVLAVSEAEAAVTLAQQELAKLEAGSRPEELERLRAEHTELQALAVLAGRDVERFEPLVLVDKIKSEAELENLRAQRDAAVARAAAKAAQVAQAEAGTRPEDLAIAAAKLAQSEARLAVAHRNKAKTRLIARRGGVVLDRLAAVGDHLAVGAPVFEVLDPSDLEIAVEVPGRYLAKLTGSPAVILSADDLPGWSMAATLDATIPAADEKSRNFTGLVRLDRDDTGYGDLRAGMFVRLALELRPIEHAMIVPEDAIRQTERGPEVVLARFGPPGPRGHPSVTAEVLAVEVLAVFEGRAAVVAAGDLPLSAGDQVVVTGVDSAFPGADLLPARDGPDDRRADRRAEPE
jgi:HlyD family secretion protein